MQVIHERHEARARPYLFINNTCTRKARGEVGRGNQHVRIHHSRRGRQTKHSLIPSGGRPEKQSCGLMSNVRVCLQVVADLSRRLKASEILVENSLAETEMRMEGLAKAHSMQWQACPCFERVEAFASKVLAFDCSYSQVPVLYRSQLKCLARIRGRSSAAQCITLWNRALGCVRGRYVRGST